MSYLWPFSAHGSICSTSISYHCYLVTLIQHQLLYLLCITDPLFSTTFQVRFAHLEDDQQANWGHHQSASCHHLVQMYAAKLRWSLDRADGIESMEAEQEELPAAEHIFSRDETTGGAEKNGSIARDQAYVLSNIHTCSVLCTRAFVYLDFSLRS